MKKFLFTISMVLCATLMHAQDNAMLKAIEEANASLPNIVAQFTQTKHLVANNKQIVSNGDIYIADNDKMAMYYNEPASDLLIINAEQFYMKQGKKDKVYNTAKNKPMASLSNTLLSCVRGKAQALAEANNADITTNKTDKGYEVTLLSREQKAKGYAKIVLIYDSKTKLLTSMQMDEFNGISTIYQLSDIKTGIEIDSLRFKIK